MKKLFTSESVTKGHPDKICDIISDSILDECLRQDEHSRVACETMVTTNTVYIVGEITTNANINFEKVVRDTIKEIGYDKDEYGFNYKTCRIHILLDKQSPDIAQGVDGEELGAGDQGMMFGYACKDTTSFMPLPITLAHRLTEKLTETRENKTLPYLRPDGKAQVTVEYEDNKPIKIDTIVISAQHDEHVSQEQIKKDIIDNIIKKIKWEVEPDDNTKIYINPTGKFVIGGPQGDSGLTGRKIIVDTYGGMGRHGGGAFSGKDATKVDRSAAYAARWVAKNLIAAGVADRLEIQLAYAIGVANPVSIQIDTFGTSNYTNENLSVLIKSIFKLTPNEIIKELKLHSPIYFNTATNGHFGKEIFEWEKLNKVKEIKKYIENNFQNTNTQPRGEKYDNNRDSI